MSNELNLIKYKTAKVCQFLEILSCAVKYNIKTGYLSEFVDIIKNQTKDRYNSIPEGQEPKLPHY